MFYILKGSLQKLKLQKVWPRNDLESRRLKAMVVMMIVRCTFSHFYVRPLYVLRLDKRGSHTPLVYSKVHRWHAGNRLSLYRTIQALQLQHCSHVARRSCTEENQTWTVLLGKGSSWRYVYLINRVVRWQRTNLMHMRFKYVRVHVMLMFKQVLHPLYVCRFLNHILLQHDLSCPTTVSCITSTARPD